jgi:predicted lactoylglutathione lyase
MKTNMTITMSILDWQRYEDFIKKYNDLNSEIYNCLIINNEDRIVLLDMNKFSKFIKNRYNLNDYSIMI